MRASLLGIILGAFVCALVCAPIRAQGGPLSISNIAPSSGPVGMPVILSGLNFGTSQGTSTVSLNGTNAMATSWTDTAITVLVPSGATSGTFSVTVNGEVANSAIFTVTALPTGWSDQDIGSVGMAGSATYANGMFTVKGSGTGIGGSADQMHFAYQSLSGDGTIVARVASVSGGYTPEVGVAIRQTLNANDQSASAYSKQNYADFTCRPTTGGASTTYSTSGASLPMWIEVVRSGNTFSAYKSSDGLNWVQLSGSPVSITMATNVYVGLAVSSGSNSSLATATFDNVSISSTALPAPVITSLSATTGAVGGEISIYGSNFGSSQGSSLVFLNDMPVTVNSWDDTLVIITIPGGATSGPMVVSVGPSMNDSNPVEFAVTSQPLPTAWLDQDIGTVGLVGSATYANGVFTIKGSGTGIGGSADQMHFVYESLSGDGAIVARVASISGGFTPEVGVAIRQTLNTNDENATVYFKQNSINFTWRSSTGGNTGSNGNSSASLPIWVKLVRSGNSFSAYKSSDGLNWVQAAGSPQSVTMATNVYVGLVVSSGSNSSVATAT